jgi:hypothetical protein
MAAQRARAPEPAVISWLWAVPGQIRWMYWLAYRQGFLTCVMIVEADSLFEARLKVDVGLIGGHAGIDAHFLEGHDIAGDPIPAAAVGRLMSAEDAAKLIERIDRIPKKPPAPSVRREAGREARRAAR